MAQQPIVAQPPVSHMNGAVYDGLAFFSVRAIVRENNILFLNMAEHANTTPDASVSCFPISDARSHAAF